jgi:hypothetical protein
MRWDPKKINDVERLHGNENKNSRASISERESRESKKNITLAKFRAVWHAALQSIVLRVVALRATTSDDRKLDI